MGYLLRAFTLPLEYMLLKTYKPSDFYFRVFPKYLLEIEVHEFYIFNLHYLSTKKHISVDTNFVLIEESDKIVRKGEV